MGKPSKRITDFMASFNVDHDEIWEIPGGTNWAIKHSALERVAAEQNIVFEPPQIATREFETIGVAVLVIGHFGNKTEWSFGEASPLNLTRKSDKKPLYPWAMAEKRAKDRVTLKLLNLHGALYSDAEAEELEQRPNPHVTRPSDIVPEAEYDDNGQPIDNIPRGDDRIERAPKAKVRADYAAAQNEMHATKTPAELETWGKKNANRVESYPSDWQEILRGQYAEHMAELRKGKAA